MQTIKNPTLFLSSTLTILASTVLSCFCYFYLPKDSEIVVAQELIKQFYVLDSLKPEPAERKIFLIFLITLPLFALTFVQLTKKKAIKDFFLNSVQKSSSSLKKISTFVLPLMLTVWLLNQNRLKIIFGIKRLDFIISFLIAVSFSVLLFKLRKDNFSKKMKLSLLFLFICLVCLWRVFGISAVTDEWEFSVHLDAVLYSTVQSLYGKLPFIDFTPQYGSYGLLLKPYFYLFGLSLLSFTILMYVLQVLATFFVVIVASRRIYSILPLFLLTCCILLFASNWAVWRESPDPYFQSWPIRFFFPSLFLLLFDNFLRKENLKAEWVTSFCVSLAFLWNGETGLVLMVSWFFYLSFTRRFKALLRLLATFTLVIGIFSFYLKINSGMWPSLFIASKYQRLFYQMGFFMLPMPLRIHPWQLVLVTLSVGLVKGFQEAKNKENNFFLVLSLMGFGLFTYYQGRSHDDNLFAVSWPAILILFFLSFNKDARVSFKNPFMIFALIFGIFSFSGIIERIPIYFSVTKKNMTADKKDINEKIDLLTKFFKDKENEKVTFIARHASLYLGYLKRSSSLKGPGINELVLWDDINSQNDQLLNDMPTYLVISDNFLNIEDINFDHRFKRSLYALLPQYQLITKSSKNSLFVFQKK